LLPLFATGVNYTGGKFAAGVIDNLPPVSLIPVVHLDSRISPRIFEKIRKSLNWNTLGLAGNWFMKKTRSKKSRHIVP
jgi:hypothetical protein